MKEFQHPLFDETYLYNKLVSTSNQASKMIKQQAVRGNFLVIANEQTGGKGRGKNTWFSPPGGIWMTAAIYGLSVSSSLTIFTGVCIHKALSDLFPEIEPDLKIKWPNDIFLNDQKLCGILSSYNQLSKYHLLGIGINSNVEFFPEETENIATSLSKILKSEVDNELIISRIFNHFAADLPEFIEGNFDLDYFRMHSFLKGKEIVLDTDFDQFSGLCKGINKSGAILIELKPGMIQPFYSGSIVNWTKE